MKEKEKPYEIRKSVTVTQLAVHISPVYSIQILGRAR
jgi:hypothetical protein